MSGAGMPGALTFSIRPSRYPWSLVLPTASILIRLSKQAGESNLSLAGMEADCRALADRHGYTVAAVRVDDGLSGAIRNRPGFLQWLDDGRAGRVDCLISWSGDRLSREGVNAAALVLDVVEGKDAGSGAVTARPVRFITADDGLDSSGDPTGFRFNFVIKAEVARAERERIVARNATAQRRLRREVGRYRGGERPYGYAVATRREGGKTLIVDPAEAAIVREVAGRVLAGTSLYAISLDLTARNVPTRRGGPWRIPTLQNLLTAPYTAGYALHRGQPIRGEDGNPIRWYEPVLEEETLAQLRRIVRAPARGRGSHALPGTAGRVAKATRLLSGAVTAACCGGRLYGVRASPSKPTALYRQPADQVGACRTQVSIRAEALEEFVTAEFLARFGHFSEVRPITTGDARADLAAVEREIHEAARAMTEPEADLGALSAHLVALHARREEVAARPDVDEVKLLPTGRSIAEAWTASEDLHARRALILDALDGPIVITPVGRARRVRGLDTERVTLLWRGETAPDYLAGQA
ncbi:recombinase family protein [Nocardioides lentus]|uniref:Recombinase family protein n=1 Tax=Nocardioides lentus TaxID=338077 RepID=A0ABP5AXC9_9ACTN